MRWKQMLVVLVIIVSMFMPPSFFKALAIEATGEYFLNSAVKVSVKSILNEQVSEGTRIGAVVRLTNEGDKLTRVPDYEIRAKTEDGVSYGLLSSKANPVAIQPKETVELSYMIVIDREDAFSVSELSWVDVDEYASPKIEKTIISIPVSAIQWRGDNTRITEPSSIKKWGEAFVIPALSASIQFQGVSFNEQPTPQGMQTILELLATNTTDQKKAIPNFRVNAQSDTKVFNGQRLEKDPIVLEPGEQRYLHYLVPAASKDAVKSLMVLSPHSFTIDDKTTIDFTIGQLSIVLPEDGMKAAQASNPTELYTWNRTIEFDPLNKVIPPQVGVSLVSLRMHEGIGGGFKAVVAKFKLQNRSDNPILLPPYQAQLIAANGSIYAGTRQTKVVDSLIPNMSYVVYYTFVLPSNEKGDALTMQLLDNTSIAPYSLPIASLKTKIQTDTADGALQFYPFQVSVNSWKVEVYMGSPKEALPYSYKLKLDLDIQLQDSAIVDQSFPKLKAELVDGQGRIIGSKALSFTDENKLVSGSQTINLDSILFEFTNSLRIYETVETPFGQAERLLTTLH